MVERICGDWNSGGGETGGNSGSTAGGSGWTSPEGSFEGAGDASVWCPLDTAGADCAGRVTVGIGVVIFAEAAGRGGETLAGLSHMPGEAGTDEVPEVARPGVEGSSA